VTAPLPTSESTEPVLNAQEIALLILRLILAHVQLDSERLQQASVSRAVESTKSSTMESAAALLATTPLVEFVVNAPGIKSTIKASESAEFLATPNASSISANKHVFAYLNSMS